MSFDPHFHFFPNLHSFLKKGGQGPLDPPLVFYGWENFYIKNFFFQFEFLFYAVYMTLCAIVFQCNLVKHIKSVFWKIHVFFGQNQVFFYKKIISQLKSKTQI